MDEGLKDERLIGCNPGDTILEPLSVPKQPKDMHRVYRNVVSLSCDSLPPADGAAETWQRLGSAVGFDMFRSLHGRIHALLPPDAG